MTRLASIYLGHAVDYRRALALQVRLVELVQQRELSYDPVLLLQHCPIFTGGRRVRGPEADDEEKRLKQLGHDYLPVQRGGQVTYHGPGQLVCYPIVRIRRHCDSIRGYVASLEKSILSLCHEKLGLLDAKCTKDTGVFIGDPLRKLAAVGIHITRGVSSHGLALNCSANVPDAFDAIIACGLPQIKQTSLVRELKSKDRTDLTLLANKLVASKEENVVPHLLEPFMESLAKALKTEHSSLLETDREMFEEIMFTINKKD